MTKYNDETEFERKQRRIALLWWTAVLIAVGLAGMIIGLRLLP